MKYGFIGTGNMASAIIKVMSEKVNGSDIYLSNRTEAKASALAEKYGANVSTNVEIAKTCDYIVLGVKPQMMKGVLDEIKPALAERDDFIIVSMAAGFTIDDYYEMISKECPLIRIMPNTPVMVNEGVILYCYKNIEKNKVDEFVNAIEKAGKLIDIDEGHFDVAGTVSGCGPAFADMIIEALADGGVYCGLTRKQSIELAAQMLVGAGKLVLESGKNPIELKDEVTSPGGTTIVGVRTLEENRVPYALMSAVINAYKKTEELRKK